MKNEEILQFTRLASHLNCACTWLLKHGFNISPTVPIANNTYIFSNLININGLYRVNLSPQIRQNPFDLLISGYDANIFSNKIVPAISAIYYNSIGNNRSYITTDIIRGLSGKTSYDLEFAYWYGNYLRQKYINSADKNTYLHTFKYYTDYYSKEFLKQIGYVI